jgi:Zn-dependent peptidase ImmA (M78 family)
MYAYRDDERDPREMRANAFAIHLLLPEKLLLESWGDGRDVRRIMTTFGVNYEAVRHHLDNYSLVPLYEKTPRVATTATDDWKNAESGELWYPAFDVIPIERRHTLASLAFGLWRERKITTSRLREVLGARLTDSEARELAELYEEPAAA